MPDDAWHDIDWDVLTRYGAGDCTPEERAQVDAWLAAVPDRRELLAAAYRVGAPLAEPPLADLKARVLAGIGGARRAAPAGSRAFPWAGRSRWRSVLQAAAAVAVVVGGYLALRSWRPELAAPGAAAMPTHQIATALGERRAVRFGDGTEVTLGPGSTLRWHADYGRRDRAVELEGEAVFSVVHDSTRPFSVRTEHLVARDLGTRFVVRAYRGAAPADVVVAEGVVAVQAAAESAAAPVRGGAPAGDSLVIGPGDRARVAGDGRMALARGVALAPYFDWAEGRLVFQNTPLREAVERIGRWYNVEVRLDDPRLGDLLVTASFGPEPGSRALQFIAVVLGLEVERRGSTYVLRSR